jgi:hypothetical protein
VGPRAGWAQRIEEKSSASFGDRTAVAHSVASHYTEVHAAYIIGAIRLTRLHGAATQKTAIFVLAAVRISNLSLRRIPTNGFNLFSIFIQIRFRNLGLSLRLKAILFAELQTIKAAAIIRFSFLYPGICVVFGFVRLYLGIYT